MGVRDFGVVGMALGRRGGGGEEVREPRCVREGGSRGSGFIDTAGVSEAWREALC